MKSLFLNEFRSSLFSNLLSLKEIHEIFDWIVKPLSKGTQASSAKVIGNDTIRWYYFNIIKNVLIIDILLFCIVIGLN